MSKGILEEVLSVLKTSDINDQMCFQTCVEEHILYLQTTCQHSHSVYLSLICHWFPLWAWEGWEGGGIGVTPSRPHHVLTTFPTTLLCSLDNTWWVQHTLYQGCSLQFLHLPSPFLSSISSSQCTQSHNRNQYASLNPSCAWSRVFPGRTKLSAHLWIDPPTGSKNLWISWNHTISNLLLADGFTLESSGWVLHFTILVQLLVGVLFGWDTKTSEGQNLFKDKKAFSFFVRPLLLPRLSCKVVIYRNIFPFWQVYCPFLTNTFSYFDKDILQS